MTAKDFTTEEKIAYAAAVELICAVTDHLETKRTDGKVSMTQLRKLSIFMVDSAMDNTEALFIQDAKT